MDQGQGTSVQTYATLDGVVLNLGSLSDEQRAFMERCLEAWRRDVPFDDFVALVWGGENPVVRELGGGRVNRAVWEHPLFRAARDLEDRLGIRQGHVGANPGDEPERDPVADEWLPVAEAARRKGVAMTGLHKAIRRGDVVARPARPGGSWLLVSANSLRRWTPDPVRQAVGRRGAEARRQSVGR